MANDMRKLEKLAYNDSGAVDGVSDYRTVVNIHGLAFHSGNFTKVFALGPSLNARIVLLNRRDYPGSDPYNEDEKAQIAAIEESPKGHVSLDAFYRQRAQEIFDFLVAFIRQENIPEAKGDRGGIILTAWSFGNATLLAILAHFSSFESDIDLSKYIRRADFYDPPFHVMGYPPPADQYNPLLDDEISSSERQGRFALWLSGYYNHGRTEETLERRKELKEPRPTIPAMTQEEVQSSIDTVTSAPEGNDITLLWRGISTGCHESLRKRVFYDQGINHWAKLPLRYLQCDNSVWETAWSELCVRDELRKAQERGIDCRDIRVANLNLANHFVHWDDPERFIGITLEEDMTKVTF